MDVNILEVLDSYKGALDLMLERIDRQDEMIQALINELDRTESVLFDGIINPANALRDQAEYDSGLKDFRAKYGEKLDKFGPAVARLDGVNPEGYDVTKDFYDIYKSTPDEEKPENVDDYVNDVIASLEEQFASLKEALNLPADAPVEVEQDKDGEIQVKVDKDDIKESEETAEPNEMEAYEKELRSMLK